MVEHNFKKDIIIDRILVLGILVIFLSLRIISWSNVSTFEDHDSVSYLNTAKIIENQQWEKLNSVSTFFYPSTIYLFKSFGLNLETSARFVSLFFSTILFFSLYFIGKKLTSTVSTLIGLLIISLSPYLISLSISVLSEPTYIGLVYLGIFLFWYFVEKPKLFIAFLIGLIFGLSFSARSEGIIFIIFIPLFQLIHFIFWGKKNYSFSKILSCFALFIIGFSLIAVPVIKFISSQMGTFSINGRTAWEGLLKSWDNKSYEEKLQGLDFSQSETNLNYVISHPEVLKKIDKSNSFYKNLKLFFNNIAQLYRNKLSSVVGFLVLVLFGIGVYHFFRKQKFKDLFLVLTFIVTILIPPLFLSSYLERHIAIVAPMIMIVSGVGLNELSKLIENSILNKRIYRFIKSRVSVFLIVIMILFSINWMNKALRHPSSNQDYNPDNYIKPLSILKNDMNSNKTVETKLVARKMYFSYFGNIEGLTIPYTDYSDLLKYCNLNHVSYIFLEYKHLKEYPFLINFEIGEHTNLICLYSGFDQGNNKIELYRFKSLHE